MPELPATSEQAQNIIAQISVAAGQALVFTPGEGAEAGVLTFPAAFAGEIAAADGNDPRARLLAYAANRRWQNEVGGTTVGSVPIATDDRSKTMVLGARVAAAADPGWETVWHGADGQTYPLNAAAMIAISNAVEAHVNATFATFAAVKADIEAGEITTFAEIDAAFA